MSTVLTLIGVILGYFLGWWIIYRREMKKDREFYNTMFKLYDDARKAGAPTTHLDNVLKSTNPRNRQ